MKPARTPEDACYEVPPEDRVYIPEPEEVEPEEYHTPAGENGNGKANGKPKSTRKPILTCFADIKRISVPWLWQDHFPLGRISVLAGRQGVGKSFLTAEIAAIVTNGRAWPDGAACPDGSVIFVSAEDGAEDTTGPRLDAHQADSARIFNLTGSRLTDPDGKPHDVMFTLQDVATLEDCLIEHPDCKLVIIDPLGSFIGGKTDSYKDNEVRDVLQPIGELARKYGPAILLVCHLRKAFSSNADDGVLGSRGITGIARSVWHLSFDKGDKGRRLLLPGKCNLCKTPPGAALSIGGEEGQPRAVIWEPDPVDLHADDVQETEGGYGPEAKSKESAKTWLAKVLENGPVKAGDLHKPDADSVRGMAEEAGVAWRTVRRASEELFVIKEKCQFSKVWMWRLPK